MTELLFATFLIGILGLGLGGLIGVLAGSISKRLNAVMLSFSAGTMIALICFELLHEAMAGSAGTRLAAIGALLGAALVSLLDYAIDRHSGHTHDFITCADCDEEFEHDSHHLHCEEHSHEHADHRHQRAYHNHQQAYHSHGGHLSHNGEDKGELDLELEHGHIHEGAHATLAHHHKKASHLQLLLAGVMMAVGVAIHNVPEGMSIGAIYADNGYELTSALQLLLFSILLHNIPEGMAIALPLFTSGMSRPKAVLWAAATGIPMVLGALLGYVIGDMGELGLSLTLSFAAGTLLYVVFGEVLPQSINLYCSRKTAFAAITGLLLGMLIIGGHVH